MMKWVGLQVNKPSGANDDMVVWASVRVFNSLF